MPRLKSISSVLALAFLLCSCNAAPMKREVAQEAQRPSQAYKLKVVATLFPQYDFARQIAGDRIELTLLLPPGVESHSYDPTPADILTVSECDAFIYTGKDMEPWAERILSGSSVKATAIDVSEGIELESADHEEDLNDSHDHHGEPDPHIWLNPLNAVAMVENILDGLKKLDPENAQLYERNAENYKRQLITLDSDFQKAVENSAHKTLVFGGRFAFYYMMERYGIDYRTAYDSCSNEAEPSVARIAQLIEFMEENHTPVIYHEEMVDPKVARSMATQVGAQLLELHSVHNITDEQRKKGVTYLDLMRSNLANIKIGLG